MAVAIAIAVAVAVAELAKDGTSLSILADLFAYKSAPIKFARNKSDPFAMQTSSFALSFLDANRRDLFEQ